MTLPKEKKTKSAIFLIGYMASGKTTLSNAVRELTQTETFDLDQEVEKAAGMTVSEIFSRLGEAEFRRLESEILRSLARPSVKPRIIACGGGTPCHNGNMELMNSLGKTVWLKATPARIYERLRIARASRPIVASLSDSELLDKVNSMLEERKPFYAKAKYTFGANRLESEAQVRSAALRFVRRFLQSE